MSLFSNAPLKRSQIKLVMRETGCSKEDAISLAESALDAGMSIEQFMNGQFYKMDENELHDYMDKAAPRRYVEALKMTNSDLPDFEIYSQIKKAKDDYGISYSAFAKNKLLNASDDEFEAVRDEICVQEKEALHSIADSLAISDEESKETVEKIKSKFGYNAREINRNGLYLMSNKEISQWKKRKKSRQQDMLANIEEATGWSKIKIQTHMSHCFIEFGIASSMYYCLKCYEMPDWQLALCANTRDSKKLSSKYNTGQTDLLDDKTHIYTILKDYMGRKYWINRDTSFEEFLEFSNGLEEVFCKPVDSKAGTGAYKFTLSGKDPRDVYDYFMSQPKYLIEECIKQHSDMAKFYPESINTIRLISVLDNDEFDPFLVVARFGVDGVVDNFSSGGIACGVDPKTGLIMTDGCNKYGDVFEFHPVTGVKFKGFQIPHWDEVLESAEASLRAVEGIDFVGWDFAIEEDGIVVVEGNAGPGFTAPQTAWFNEGKLIRDSYYKYLDTSVYDKMLDKVADNMKKYGLSENDVTVRLVEAANCGLDYAFVEKEAICRMTPEQIKSYSDNEEVRKIVDKRAERDNSTIAEAFFRVVAN